MGRPQGWASLPHQQYRLAIAHAIVVSKSCRHDGPALCDQWWADYTCPGIVEGREREQQQQQQQLVVIVDLHSTWDGHNTRSTLHGLAHRLRTSSMGTDPQRRRRTRNGAEIWHTPRSPRRACQRPWLCATETRHRQRSIRAMVEKSGCYCGKRPFFFLNFLFSSVFVWF